MKANRIELECDLCHAPITKSISGNISWFVDPNGWVKEFTTICGDSECYAEISKVEHVLMNQGLYRHDHHSEEFFKNPMWRLQELVWSYQWQHESPVLRKMLDLFMAVGDAS